MIRRRSEMLFRIAVMKNFFTEHLHVAASFIFKKIRRSYHGTHTHLRINWYSSGVFRTQSNIYDEGFHKNSERLSGVNCICRKLHLRLRYFSFDPSIKCRWCRDRNLLYIIYSSDHSRVLGSRL